MVCAQNAVLFNVPLWRLVRINFKKFPEFAATYNLQELLLWVKKCTFTSFVFSGMRSEGNAPKKMTNSWSLFHDNASAQQSVFVKDLLAKNRVTNTGASPILSW